MKNLLRRDLAYYVDKLERHESFGFVRYGDGEWFTILGYYGRKNSNGCTFTKELSKDLIRGIRKEHSYDYSILRIAYRRSRKEIKTWLRNQDIKIKWILGDFLLQASIDGKLYPLVQQLRERKILYVGPRHCRKLHNDFFELTAFVEPPPIDAHKKKAEVERAIFNTLDETDIDFIGFSSGLAGKVFIGDVWEYTNGEIPIMDFGSSWDGYYGVQSRSYIRRGHLNFTQLRKQNLKEIQI